jgi:drug/metabolite transporter (DMT)-like permease
LDNGIRRIYDGYAHRCVLYVILAILLMFPLVVDYTFYYSLSHTSVSINTAIWGAEPVFVFVLSIFILREEVYPLKIASVILTLGGVAVIGYFGSGDSVLCQCRVLIQCRALRKTWGACIKLSSDSL